MLVVCRKVPVHGRHLQWNIGRVQSTRAGHSRYPSVLTTTFDALIRVFVEGCEVFPELLVVF